jgi:hypothetical protein
MCRGNSDSLIDRRAHFIVDIVFEANLPKLVKLKMSGKWENRVIFELWKYGIYCETLAKKTCSCRGFTASAIVVSRQHQSWIHSGGSWFGWGAGIEWGTGPGWELGLDEEPGSDEEVGSDEQLLLGFDEELGLKEESYSCLHI